MNIEQEAREAVQGLRRHDYGPCEVNHARTAALWDAYLSRKEGAWVTLDPEDVCWMNVLQKISREMHSDNRDSLVDIIGYVLNIAEIRGD